MLRKEVARGFELGKATDVLNIELHVRIPTFDASEFQNFVISTEKIF